MRPIDCDHFYRNGKHYDLLNKDFVEDIPFWVIQARKCNGTVLELACGTGRITIPLAREGFPITGLDLSVTMLDEARNKALLENARVDWIHDDCRSFNHNKSFDLIFFPFNSMGHLHSQEDIESCLFCVKKHLKPEGRFIIDIFNPNLHILIRDACQRYPLSAYDDPDGNGLVEIAESNTYDDATQINRIKMYYRIGCGEERTDELNMRIFYPQEIDAILKYNGFKIQEKFGDYNGNPFKSGSPKQIIVCQNS